MSWSVGRSPQKRACPASRPRSLMLVAYSSSLRTQISKVSRSPFFNCGNEFGGLTTLNGRPTITGVPSDFEVALSTAIHQVGVATLMRTTEPGKGISSAAVSNSSMRTVPSKVWLGRVMTPLCGLPNHESLNGAGGGEADFSAVKIPTVTGVGDPGTLMFCNGLNQTDLAARASSKGGFGGGLPVTSLTLSTGRNANCPSAKLSRSRSPAASLLLRSFLTRTRKLLS